MGEVVTEPGIYQMDADQYHADPVPGGSLSASGAKLLLPPNSPAIYRHRADNPPPSTAAMELGTAAHMRILGEGPPIHVIHANEWRTDKVKKEVAEARANGEIPLKPHDAETLDDMTRVLRQHKTADLLLQPGSGLPEQSIFWEDPTYQIWRRARLDWLPHGTNGLCIISDYKTSGQSIHPDTFSRTMYNLGYPAAAAQYCDAVEAARPGTETWFVWIVQETFPPYQVACYWAKGPEHLADPDIITYGHTQMQRACEIYRDCQESGRWLTHSEPDQDIQTIHLPRWAANRSVDND